MLHGAKKLSKDNLEDIFEYLLINYFLSEIKTNTVNHLVELKCDDVKTNIS